MHWKFRDQILITFLLVGLVPSVLISYQTFNDNSEQVKSFAIDTAQSKVRAIALGLAVELNEAARYVELYARHEDVRSMEYERFMPLLERELAFLRPKYDKFIVGTPAGHFYNTAGANLAQGGIRTFDDTDPNSRPRTIIDRDYWQQVLSNNVKKESLTYISEPMISYTNGVKQVVAASSIRGANNELVGMIGLSISWDRMKSVIESLIESQYSSLRGKPRIMLVSKDGTYWFHWEQDKVIRLLTDEKGEFVTNSNGEKKVIKSSILRERNPDLLKVGSAMVNGLSGVDVVKQDGNTEYVIYESVAGTGYSVGLALDEQVILVPAYTALEEYLSLLAFSVLVIRVIGIALARYFSEPIAELVNKLGHLSRGISVDRGINSNNEDLIALSNAIFDLYDKINAQSATIRLERERFDLLAQGSNDGIWEWDLESGAVYLSPRWKEIIGYEDDELIDSPHAFESNIHPGDVEKVDKGFNEIIRGNTNFSQVRYRMIHKDGSIVSILARCVVVRSKSGKTLRIIGTNTDISELVAHDDEMLALNRSLEAKVAQRTEEHKKALDEAEKANQAKSTFLSHMSHEIRTPMNGIIGLTQLVLNTELSEIQREYLDKIMTSSRILLKIINEILDFQKIESNLIELDYTEVHLKQLVLDVDALMRPAADAKDIDLAIHLDESLPETVLADAVRLTQILLNLCGNGIKFTNQGGVKLSVSFHGDQAVNHECIKGISDLQLSSIRGSARVKFEIQDSGIGIKNTENLFDPFKQEDASTTRKFGGTGLGLAISKRLVDLMGGELVFQSRLGEGSTFSFSIDVPIINESITQTAQIETHKESAFSAQKALDNASVSNDQNVSGAQLLVVEDNEVNQLVAEHMLEKCGYKVTMANNGEQALSLIGQRRFDLVLMDIQMPVMDGEEATKHLKASPETKDIPVIALTANVMRSDTERYKQIGFAAVIGKPFIQQDLQEAIQKVLNSHVKFRADGK